MSAATPEPNDNAANEGRLGTVRIAPQVLATIARLTTLSVPGVSRMYRDLSSGVDRLLKGKSAGDGVRIEVVDGAVAVTTFVVAAQGVNLYELADTVTRLQSVIDNGLKTLAARRAERASEAERQTQAPAAR